MNKQQYLLVKLAEEASEIAQSALKFAQFGMGSINPSNGLSNREELFLELDDLQGVIELLREEGVNYLKDWDRIAQKTDKVMVYMNICQELGTVEE